MLIKISDALRLRFSSHVRSINVITNLGTQYHGRKEFDIFNGLLLL